MYNKYNKCIIEYIIKYKWDTDNFLIERLIIEFSFNKFFIFDFRIFNEIF